MTRFTLTHGHTLENGSRVTWWIARSYNLILEQVEAGQVDQRDLERAYAMILEGSHGDQEYHDLVEHALQVRNFIENI